MKPLERAGPLARARAAERLRRRRAAEYDDASDFLYRGEEHAVSCIHSPVCSRTYNPMPDKWSAPADPSMYEDTGVGALYGEAGGERLLWQLAGWSLGRGGL